jgi:hypothetical protein
MIILFPAGRKCLSCVDNSQGADRAILSPPHPKAAIQIPADSFSAWLKGAIKRH